MKLPYEWGTKASRRNVRLVWVKSGPFMVEFHRGWWRFGFTFGRYYIGAYLGLIVVSFGKRTFYDPPEKDCDNLITWKPRENSK